MAQLITVIRGNRELVGKSYKSLNALAKDLIKNEQIVISESKGTEEAMQRVGFRKVSINDDGKVEYSRPESIDMFDIGEVKVTLKDCLVKARNELGNFNPQAVVRAHELLALASN